MPSEPFGWPEGYIYVYPTGTASAVMAYAEGIELRRGVEWGVRRYFGGTGTAYTRMVVRSVSPDVLTIEHLFHTMEMYAKFVSATAQWVDVRFSSVAGNSAGFRLPSAVFQDWNVQHTDGDVARSRVSIIAAEVSAYGTAV